MRRPRSDSYAVCESIIDLGTADDTHGAFSKLIEHACRLVPTDHGAALFTLKGRYPRCVRWPEYAAPRVQDFNSYFNRRIPILDNHESLALGPVSWRQYRDTEYVADFHNPLRIHHSVGASFLDSFTGQRYVFWLHRYGRKTVFSEKEAATLRLLCRQAACVLSLRSELDAVRREAIYDSELGSDADILSRRELEVAKLICRHLSMQEVADLLRISRRTVERHAMHIYQKLRVANRKELALLLCKRIGE